MKVNENGVPYWTAPSGKDYALPKDYVTEENIISILHHLKRDGLFSTRLMIMRELDLLD